ncbi:hypothetical protein HOA92_07605 [archaeon]|jgi:hypothetical protein|nr:hypothetical protein [archaeon]MBT6762878.1 hypothetical protein [archaeon]MBT7706913.1 hypothetical protein [archaeon]
MEALDMKVLQEDRSEHIEYCLRQIGSLVNSGFVMSAEPYVDHLCGKELGLYASEFETLCFNFAIEHSLRTGEISPYLWGAQ